VLIRFFLHRYCDWLLAAADLLDSTGRDAAIFFYLKRSTDMFNPDYGENRKKI
jgi:hypothetical protein